MDAAINLSGSLVADLAITVKAICPGSRCFLPSSLVTILHSGGIILDTETRFRSLIAASRKASSKLVRYSLCNPLPFVKNIIFATNDEPSEENFVVLFPPYINLLGHVKIDHST